MIVAWYTAATSISGTFSCLVNKTDPLGDLTGRGSTRSGAWPSR